MLDEFEDFKNSSFYLKQFNYDENDILNCYLELYKKFNILFEKNIKITDNKEKHGFINWLYKRGIKTINYVFKLLLINTNNIDFTYYHTEKAIYYFTEFLTQIKNKNSFIKLSSQDAILFVYKRTIFLIEKKQSNILEHNTVVDNIDLILKILYLFSNYKNIEAFLDAKNFILEILKNNHQKHQLLKKLFNHIILEQNNSSSQISFMKSFINNNLKL